MTDPATVAEPLGAVCSFLQSAVGQQLAVVPDNIGLRRMAGSPAVFAPDLPKAFDKLMPAACIVVREAGGYKRFGRSMMPIGDPIMDIVCYGTTQMQAKRIGQAVIVSCKQLVMRRFEDTMLHAIDLVSGLLPLVDPKTLWPAYAISVNVLHVETAAV